MITLIDDIGITTGELSYTYLLTYILTMTIFLLSVYLVVTH